MSSSIIMLAATRTTVIDDAYWQANAPDTSATARATLASRIRSMQSLMSSRYLTASSMSSRLTIEGQVYVVLVTQT